jgi:hypothetical protein
MMSLVEAVRTGSKYTKARETHGIVTSVVTTVLFGRLQRGQQLLHSLVRWVRRWRIGSGGVDRSRLQLPNRWVRRRIGRIGSGGFGRSRLQLPNIPQDVVQIAEQHHARDTCVALGMTW